MPRGYAPAPARPATSRSCAVPGAGDPVADALLRARRATANAARFTPEHRAAYVAFAGITDRSVMLMLHRAGVNWDAVNDYTAAGVPAAAYSTMVSLAERRATPKVTAAWLAAFAAADLTAPTWERIAEYAEAGITPGRARHYLRWVAEDDVPRRAAMLTAGNLKALLDGQISPARCGFFLKAGITRATVMVSLTRTGVTPRVVSAYRRYHPFRIDESRFATRCLHLHTLTSDPDLTAAIVGNGIPDDAADWARTGLPAARVDAFLKAGVRFAEWESDEAIRTAEQATLLMLGALRGAPGS